MIVEIKRFIVKKGFGEEIVNKFSGSKKIQESAGFKDIAVLKNMKTSETEEILLEIRWEDKEAYKKWKSSDTHKQGHTGEAKQKPDYIVEVKMDLYETAE